MAGLTLLSFPVRENLTSKTALLTCLTSLVLPSQVDVLSISLAVWKLSPARCEDQAWDDCSGHQRCSYCFMTCNGVLCIPLDPSETSTVECVCVCVVLLGEDSSICWITRQGGWQALRRTLLRHLGQTFKVLLCYMQFEGVRKKDEEGEGIPTVISRCFSG